MSLAEAMAKLEKLPEGTRYASVKMRGEDVLKAITGEDSEW